MNTSCTQKSDGTISRANTEDTLRHWLTTDPIPGTCLAVSSQPFVGYQHSVARTVLPVNFEIETVGDISAEDEPLAVYLDTVARWLYQEKKRL